MQFYQWNVFCMVALPLIGYAWEITYLNLHLVNIACAYRIKCEMRNVGNWKFPYYTVIRNLYRWRYSVAVW